ncbi:tripeptidyl peptidase A [Phellopilus nigrolimitatus]|nr:tripeptidyl peptidase A [Phellopilus nigrolimitatus]
MFQAYILYEQILEGTTKNSENVEYSDLPLFWSNGKTEIIILKELVEHPRGWMKGSPAPADHILELRIALPQPNFHVLEQHLYEVSDPSHERYGEHLSKQEVEDIVAPQPESVELVDEWLISHGLNIDDFVRSPARDWVTVRVPVAVAEAMLETKYHVWIHGESGESGIRTLAYSVPEHIYNHVELIQPTTMFSRMKKQKTTFRWSSHQEMPSPSNGSRITLPNGVSVDASCNTTVTITCLKELYNAVGFNASATIGNQIGITGYLGQFANIADLQLFYADQRPDALNSSFNFVSVNGGQNSQNVSEAGDEADLDVQFAFGLTFPTPSTFFSTAGSPPFIPDIGTPTDTNEPYTIWLDFILSQDNPPQTISTSYGDDEQTVPQNFAQRVCNGFAQLGARGVSLMFSSGDGGVGDGDPDPATQQCFTNDGRNITRFVPGFPASCPFVTAVGGTIFVPEVAVSFSGGGFSNIFTRPSYQDEVVEAYLDALPNWDFCRSFQPAIPDVSAQADNFRIFLQGSPLLIGGTSASSPTFAGFVSLLNDVRLSNGMPPLGFLNPFIYSTGQTGFNDITVGNNPGCGTPGFNTSKGWDPVTGFGTPDFGKLKELVLQ